MDKNIKNIWIGIIVVVLIAGAYYFGTTSQNSSKPDVASVSKCMEDGKKFALDYKQKKSSGLVIGNQSWFDPQYHFNTKLNTCLVSVFFTVYLSADETVQDNRTIYDVYANKAILQSDIIRTYVSVSGEITRKDEVGKFPFENIPNLDEATFSDQSKVLMSE